MLGVVDEIWVCVVDDLEGVVVAVHDAVGGRPDKEAHVLDFGWGNTVSVALEWGTFTGMGGGTNWQLWQR